MSKKPKWDQAAAQVLGWPAGEPAGRGLGLRVLPVAPPPALASTAWRAARATGEDSGSGTCLVCLSQGTMSPSAPRSVLHSPGDAATQEQRAHSFCRHQAHGGPVSLQKLVSGQQGICYLVHRSPHLLSLQSRGTTHQAWAGKKDGRAAVHKRLCPQQQ